MNYVWLIEHNGSYFGGDEKGEAGGWATNPWRARHYGTRSEARAVIMRNLHGDHLFWGAEAVEHGFGDPMPGPGEETTPDRLYRETGGGQPYIDAMFEHGFLVKVPSREASS